MEFKYNNYIERVEFEEIANEIEEWKDIYGYEGMYMISNFGRVKSLERRDSIGRIVREKIMTLKDNGNGYKIVTLSLNSVKKYPSISRLVALHFVENDNPVEKMEVHHMDWDVKNNHYRNLIWIEKMEHRPQNISVFNYKKII